PGLGALAQDLAEDHDPRPVSRDSPGSRRAALELRPQDSGSAGRERARHALDAVDEVRAQQLRPAGDLEIGQPAQQLAKHDRRLAPREVRTQTVMSARAAEADVLVRLAQDVEAVRIREHRLVAVGRVVPEHDLLARAQLLTAELGVLRAGAPEVD